VRTGTPKRQRKRPAGKVNRLPSDGQAITVSSHSSSTDVSAAPPPRALTFSELYHQVRLHPHDDVAAIAGHLANRYQWTVIETEQHRRRLYDIKAAVMFNRLDELSELPIVRTPAAMDSYFISLEARLTEARSFRSTIDDE
jgi:hypothetical protein